MPKYFRTLLQPIVGAQRCAPKNTHQAMNNRADTPVCPYNKKNNKTQEQTM